MSKIADLGAQLGKLFGVGHGKTADGQRRSDRKPPRGSTTPVKSVKSRKVTFAEDIERSEHEATGGLEHPAERRSSPGLDAAPDGSFSNIKESRTPLRESAQGSR